MKGQATETKHDNIGNNNQGDNKGDEMRGDETIATEIKACYDMKLGISQRIIKHNPFAENDNPESRKVENYKKLLDIWLKLDRREKDLYESL